MPNKKKSIGDPFLDDLISKLEDESLGILKSLDFSTNSSVFLEHQRNQAAELLQRNSLATNNFIPERLLLPTTPSPSLPRFSTESTINESDLLPNESSTPRTSSAIYEYGRDAQRSRQSIGHQISSFALHMKDPKKSLDSFISSSNDLFRSSQSAEEKLKADEESWNFKNRIPTEIKEFSSVADASKMSLGAFFKGRSEEISELVCTSPEKSAQPVPLIDVTNDINLGGAEKSLSMSAIAQILSDTKQTPNKATDLLLNGRKYSTASDYASFLSKDDYQNPNYSSDSLDEIKENLDNLNLQQSKSPTHDKSSTSLRSASALSSLPEGKLPVATTKSELVWGCIKPGKQVAQNFFIRNKSPGRLKIVCTISNLNFKFEQDRSDLAFTNELKIILHPEESKKITVVFAPTTFGACFDNIYFKSLDSHHQHSTKQYVKLFAYGGHGNISLSNINKDTTGKYLLSLGSLDSSGMKKSITVQNTGSLPSFIYADFTSQNFYSANSVKIYPVSAVLQPGEEITVVVSYVPEKEEFLYLQNKVNSYVIDIGKISLIHGADVDRGRLRKICQRMQDKGMKVFSMCQKLILPFQNESMPNDIHLLKESPNSLKQIMSLIDTKDIVLTVEKDFDLTQAHFSADTTMFQSLCVNSPDFNATVTRGCIIEPSTIILNPPLKRDDIIYLHNNGSNRVYFQVASEPTGLVFEPQEGVATPNSNVMISVKYNLAKPTKTVYKVKIFADDDLYEVSVKVLVMN